MQVLKASIALSLVVLIGCAGEAATDDRVANGPETLPPPPTVDTHEHAHPSEGPHHGALIELGSEEYHAELLHDEQAGTVTIYILDGAAAVQVPIDAPQITINATHDGQPEQFTLSAEPDTNDPQGRSSRFVSNDRDLGEHLDGNAQPRLVLTIDGKSYRGEISHDHDHDHDH